MKKVTTINLEGRAYQVEEAGYNALRAYLDKAEHALADNPDKNDILADIERAIADKCDGELTGGKNVVSSSAIEAILTRIGPVEPADDEGETTSKSPDAEPTRKLYALPKEGKLSGVCAGLAAYFGMDPTIMRLLFVLLLFLTQGFMLVIYIILAIAMPSAKTTEEIALAHGRPVTAQDIMSQVNLRAPSDETMVKVGNVLNQVGRVIAQVLAIAGFAVLAAGTAAWLWLVWAIVLGYAKLYENLAFLNGWRQIVMATALYLIIAVPTYWISRALLLIGREQTGDGFTKSAKFAAGGSLALWAVSLATIMAFTSFYVGNVASYVRAHDGYLKVGEHSICLDGYRCGDRSWRGWDENWDNWDVE